VNPVLAERTLASAAEVVRQAGRVARAMRDEAPIRPRAKADDSPVTDIDLAIDALLRRELLPLVPEAGWLSEESAASLDRLDRTHVWCVDPIDGTRALISDKPEFCISVALLQDGQPLLGVVGNPTTGDLFTGLAGHGAWRNGERLRPPAARHEPDGLHLLASRTEVRDGLWDAVGADEGRVTPLSSLAWKLALVAAGEADGTATPWPRSTWDAAAGAILLAETGGRLGTWAGRAIAWNAPSTAVRGIVAAGPGRYAAVAALAHRVRGGVD
jgi:myo-inositol-1(or 4)-monophosphatase